jgi:predicted signal transduction protein with EAL and GGDEF domain
MDIGALASAMIAARVGELQLAVAAKLLRMDAQAAASAAKLIDAAEANVDRLANVAAGIGANLDVTI